MLKTDFVVNELILDKVLTVFNNLYISKLNFKENFDYLKFISQEIIISLDIKHCLLFLNKTQNSLNHFELVYKLNHGDLAMIKFSHLIKLNQNDFDQLKIPFIINKSFDDISDSYQSILNCLSNEDNVLIFPVFKQERLEGILFFITDCKDKLASLKILSKILTNELNKYQDELFNTDGFNNEKIDWKTFDLVVKTAQCFDVNLLIKHTLNSLRIITNKDIVLIAGLDKLRPFEINEISQNNSNKQLMALKSTRIPSDLFNQFSHVYKAFNQQSQFNDLTPNVKLYLQDINVKSLIGYPLIINNINSGIILMMGCNNDIQLDRTKEKIVKVLVDNFCQLYKFYLEHQLLKDQLLNIELVQSLILTLQNTINTSQVPLPNSLGSSSRLVTSNQTPLSVREIEVLTLIAQGLGNKEIAQKLFLTESTIELHSSRLKKKLLLKSRTALVKFACENGFV